MKRTTEVRMDKVKAGTVVLFNKRRHIVMENVPRGTAVCLVTKRTPSMEDDLIVGHKSCPINVEKNDESNL